MAHDIPKSCAGRRPVWLVIGASSGIGQEIAMQAQSHATVIAAGRDKSRLQTVATAGCQILELDLTSSSAVIQEALAPLILQHGFIDAIINVAGYLLEGAVEEASDEETQHIFETHVFGPLRLTRAILPSMRSAHKGTIAHVSGIGSLQGAANAGIFCASKAALSMAVEALQKEVDPLGIHVSLVQLGHFRTPFLSAGHRRKVAGHISDYDPVLNPIRAAFDSFDGSQQGDPVKGARVIVDAVARGDGTLPWLLPVGPDVPAAELQAHESRASQMQAVHAWTSVTDVDGEV
ncbi:short chain type dehydrogenase [Penicillium coprophilum]|uniref:short chain type dehydrogenase n=1 Tax=Penicillium coprophilum TaxID=36646 RepID=UPI00239478A6|nr:short chain type dehydrogenase [Penicillium coprophilum]KAJ5170454.1 short chain type dehydrogenase [Penicillium coprophilum]